MVVSQLSPSRMEEDIIFESEGNYSEIQVPEFTKAIGGQLQIVLVRNENSHERKMQVVQNQDQKMNDVKLEELIYIKNIGRGQFGDVYMVEDPNENKYAVKTVSKQKVLSLCLERHVQEERKILRMVNFPFIMDFYRTFKDNNNVYFLIEYINGMDLFDAIREIGTISPTPSNP
jgi:cGMP-dependent protein kinase 1